MFQRTLICLALLGVILGCKPTPPEVKNTVADLVIQGGVVYTVDPARTQAEAIAVLDGRVLKVGTQQEIQPHIGENTEVINLNGELVLPGFIEGHGHLLGMGVASMNLRLGQTNSWAEVIALVTQAVAEAPPGTWITGRGWHQEKWKQVPEKTVAGFPTHEALSAISPDHPVLLGHASGHAVFANAKAMELAGIDSQTPNPPGGEIIRDEQGNAIGVFSETAESLVRKAHGQWQSNKSAEERAADKKRAVTLAIEECLAKGITSFQDAGSSFADVDLFRQMASQGELGIRLWVMLGEGNQKLIERGSQYNKASINTPYLTVGGIKRYIDGALGSRGAWLLKPYADAPESTGQNVTELDNLRETAKIAKELGLQLCTHAIGDRGNREVLDLYADFVGSGDLRWRIEHAQHLHPDDIPRFAKLGVIASMQGIHCSSDAPFVEKRLGETRASEGAYVWRKLLESGAIVSNGTDVPVEDVDPLSNLHALVTRQPKSGEAFYPDQALTVAEAIQTYTMSNAHAAFEEGEKGSLEVGKWADITILSQNITQQPAEAILQTKVRFTIVGGQVKYRSQKQ